jgi:hypothetical protein
MGIVIALGVGFIAFGVLAMGASAAAVLRARREAASRLSAWGVVVALRPVTGRRGHIHCPVVQFPTETGELVTVESSVGAQPPLHVVGQRVAVYYPRGRPREGEVEAPALLWLVPAGLFAVGFLFAAVGAVMVLVFGLAALS